jgi:hypothetical protein
VCGVPATRELERYRIVRSSITRTGNTVVEREQGAFHLEAYCGRCWIGARGDEAWQRAGTLRGDWLNVWVWVAVVVVALLPVHHAVAFVCTGFATEMAEAFAPSNVVVKITRDGAGAYLASAVSLAVFPGFILYKYLYFSLLPAGIIRLVTRPLRRKGPRIG